jgi:hypothetical protein
VLELYVTLVAGVVPNSTVDPEVKLVPVMVTLVPPAVLPEVVPSPVAVGAGVLRKVNWSALEVLLVPLLVVTVMSTLPAVPAGATAVICVSELIV